MFCGKCGAKCEDGEVFCANCGAPLDAVDAPLTDAPLTGDIPEFSAEPVSGGAERPTRTPRPEKKPINPKYVGIAAVAVVAIIIIIVLVKLIGGGGGKSGSFTPISANAISTVYSNEKDATLFLSGGKIVDDLDESVSYQRSSMDQSVMAFTDYDGTLYTATSKEVKMVADDVNNCLLSADGNTLVYTNYDDELYTYSLSKGSGTRLKSDLDGGSICAMSPDGSAVAYMIRDGSDVVTYISTNGKEPVKFKRNAVPLVLSNGGKIVYYADFGDDGMYSGDADLYVMNGKTETKLAPAANIYDTPITNLDGTELLFSLDGKTYYSNGGEKQKAFTSSYITLARPGEASGSVTLGSVSCEGVDTLINHVYSVDGTLTYLTRSGKNLETVKLSSNYSNYAISSDGGKLLFQRNSDMRLISNLAKGTDGVQNLTEDGDVRNFVAGGDLGGFYFVNYDDELCYQKGSGKYTVIADDYDYYLLSLDGSTLYFTEDDTLYTSSKGGAKAPVKSEGADDVYGLNRLGSGVCYYTRGDDGYDLYYAASGAGFSLVAKDVSY